MAPVGDVEAHQRGELPFLAVAASLVDAAAHARLHAFEVVPQLDVGDAGERVRAVHRRGAAGDDFDVGDGDLRDRVEIDRARRVARDGAAAIDQRQGAVGAEAAKVHGGGARRVGAEARVVHRPRGVEHVAAALAARDVAGGRKAGDGGGAGQRAAGHEFGQLVEGLLDRDVGALLEHLAIDGDERAGGLGIPAHDARAGDLHFLKAVGGSVGLLRYGRHGTRS